MPTPSLQSLQELARAHLQANRPEQGAQVLRQIVQLYPRDSRSYFLLGVLAQHAGQADSAIGYLNQSLALDPKLIDALFIRAMAQQQARNLEPAIADYRQYLIHKPTDSKALNNLGRALLDKGELSEAGEMFRQAVSANPQNAGAWINLGEALRAGGDVPGAIAHYRKAIEVDPKSAEGHGNLGAFLVQSGDRAAGIASLRRAVELNPNLFNAHFNLTKAYLSGGPLDDAARHCQRALQIRPGHPDATDLMANLLGLAGRVNECIAARKQALVGKPNDSAIHSNLVMTLLYSDELSGRQIFDAHRQWAMQHADPLSGVSTKVARPRATGNRLRIGYVSPNFATHSVAYFFEPVLAAHDRSVVEIFCYSNLRLTDAVTARIRNSTDGWREIAGKTDAEVVQMIEQDQIDILVDLAGHTSENRLPVFARRPAPVQMTWLGYPASTGMGAIDYRITDLLTDPVGVDDDLHTEKLIRLQTSCWAYRAPESPAIGPFPAVKNGFVTFGSFNNLPKVTPRVLQTWAEILKRVPDSRLILKSTGLGSKMGRDFVFGELARHGVDPHRIELLNWTPTTSAHFHLYNRVDIALDTFPYNGTTTTCEALWMGVPVVTFTGNSHVSRVGSALLTHAGCGEWIAGSVDGYINLAVELAANIPQLMETRAGLREKIGRSPLCDATAVARELERIFSSSSPAAFVTEHFGNR